MRGLLGILAVLLLAAGGAAAYRHYVLEPRQQATASAAAKPGGFAVPVETAAVRVGTARGEVDAIGTLRANESIVIRPEVAGRVAEFRFEEGRPVTRGQPLVLLDASVQRADVARDQAALALARTNFERTSELAHRGNAPTRSLDEARAALRTAEAALLADQARLDKMTIAAPFDGVAGLRRVSVGEVLAPGTDIAHLEQIDPLKVDFRAPEAALTRIAIGQTVAVTVDAMSGRRFEGEVYAIDPLVDVAGRAVVLRARIPNPDGALRPGLFARVTLVTSERPGAVFVREEALVPAGDRHFVFKVVDADKGKKVSYVPVRLGERRHGEVEVVDGLSPGDVVVTGGVLKVRDGVPVAPVPAAAEGTGGGTGGKRAGSG